MARLLLLFILVPFVELLLLIQIGERIGLPATLALIVATGALGAWLARRQGLNVFQRVQDEMAAGRMPAAAMVDGIIILLAGAVLLTPGVLTDLVGFACLVPAVRKYFKRWLKRWFENRLRLGDVRVATDFGGASSPFSTREVRDVTPPAAESEPDGPGNRRLPD